MIDQNNLELAAIACVDRARRVENGHAVLGGKTAARADLRLISLRQFDRQSGRNAAVAVGLEREVFGGVQIKARVILMRFRRNVSALPQLDIFDRNHSLYPPLLYAWHYTSFPDFLQVCL